MNEDQQLSTLYNELADMEATAGTLKHAIQQAEALLSDQKAAHKSLIGTHFSPGAIPHKRDEIEKLRREIEDRKKPVVVWDVPPGWAEGDHIVDKITPKRIVVRRIGHTPSDQFNRDGTTVSKYSTAVIDVKATLGEDYNVDD